MDFAYLMCEAERPGDSRCQTVTAHTFVRAVPAIAGSRDLIYRCTVCGAERQWGRVYGSEAEAKAADLAT